MFSFNDDLEDPSLAGWLEPDHATLIILSRIYNNYLQAQQALGHAILAVQLLDILTVQVHLLLLGVVVAADQAQQALGHAILAVQLLDPTHPLLQADTLPLPMELLPLLWPAATSMGAGHFRSCVLWC